MAAPNIDIGIKASKFLKIAEIAEATRENTRSGDSEHIDTLMGEVIKEFGILRTMVVSEYPGSGNVLEARLIYGSNGRAVLGGV